jgi:hypothetical protein
MDGRFWVITEGCSVTFAVGSNGNTIWTRVKRMSRSRHIHAQMIAALRGGNRAIERTAEDMAHELGVSRHTDSCLQWR